MGISDWLQQIMSLSFDTQRIEVDLFQSVAIILGLWLLRWIVVLVVNYETKDVQVRYWWRKMSTYAAVLLGVLLLGPVWIGEMQSAATFLGLLTAGLAIALQGPITDLAGWMFLLIRRPFEVGDRIQIGEHAGDVIDVRIFQFAILEIGNWVDADQSTGRIIDIPNRKVFSEALANYTQGFQYIWNEIPVLITFESNWEKAKALLQEIADRHAGDVAQNVADQVQKASRRFVIKYSKLTPTVYTRVEDSGVLLTIRYLCGVRRRRSSTGEIWEDILRTFAQHADINFAYPTQRFYYNRPEEQPVPGFITNLKQAATEEDTPS